MSIWRLFITKDIRFLDDVVTRISMECERLIFAFGNTVHKSVVVNRVELTAVVVVAIQWGYARRKRPWTEAVLNTTHELFFRKYANNHDISEPDELLANYLNGRMTFNATMELMLPLCLNLFSNRELPSDQKEEFQDLVSSVIGIQEAKISATAGEFSDVELEILSEELRKILLRAYASGLLRKRQV